MDLRAIIFVPALVGAAICVFFFLMFAASYYLTILESTASGGREVTWVPEGIIDNFWKPFYFAWLLCLWLGPAYVIGRMMAGRTGVAWLTLAVPVFVAWALYPVSQLSSLSATSVWIPLHPQVFARLIQKPAVTLGFFVFTLPVFALAGIGFKWGFLTEREWHLLFIGVPMMAVALLLYARILGRLAFALMFTRDILKRKKKKKPKEKKTPENSTEPGNEESFPEVGGGSGGNPWGVPPPEQQRKVVQPSEMAPIQTPDGELAGYNILIADDPPPKKRVKAEVVEEKPEPAVAPVPPRRSTSRDPSRAWTDEDDDATPYGTTAAEVVPEAPKTAKITEPTKEEMELLARRDAPKPPKGVWTLEMFVFLGQPGTIAALVILTGLGTLAGAAVRVARMFNPAAGGE